MNEKRVKRVRKLMRVLYPGLPVVEYKQDNYCQMANGAVVMLPRILGYCQKALVHDLKKLYKLLQLQ